MSGFNNSENEKRHRGNNRNRRGNNRNHRDGHKNQKGFTDTVVITEMRDGKEVVIIDAADYNQLNNQNFKQKRVSYKQRTLEENDIDLKHLSTIQIKKKENTYSFKITNIPSIEELKRLIALQESYPVPVRN